MHNLKKIVIYLMFSLFELSAGITEFPCQFPCPWQNKTFSYYIDDQLAWTWTFDADGQTSVMQFLGVLKCYQITERFLIVRDGDSDYFRCFPIFYGLESPLEFIIGGWNQIFSPNQTREFTDLCEFCKELDFIRAYSATGSPPSSTLSLNCTRPSACSPPGVVCNSSDTISNPCPTTTVPTTAPTTAPTTEPTTEPTTTTADPKTTKSHCGKKQDPRPLI